MKKTLIILSLISAACFNNLNAELAVSTHHVKRYLAGLAYGPLGLMLRSDKQVMQNIMKNARTNDSKIIIAGAFTQLLLGALWMSEHKEHSGYYTDRRWSFSRKMSHLYPALSLLGVAVTELCGALYFSIPINEINKSASSSSSRKK